MLGGRSTSSVRVKHPVFNDLGRLNVLLTRLFSVSACDLYLSSLRVGPGWQTRL
jgi:hypothetical protein